MKTRSPLTLRAPSTLLLLASMVAAGFSHSYPFHNYTVENGLPQSSVLCMTQDKQGFFWFGTQSGVCRYDGFEFQTFDTSDGISQCRITALYCDGAGTIWAGTQDEGLFRFDGRRWHLALSREVCGGEARGMAPGSDGGSFFLTRARLFALDRNGRETPLALFPNLPEQNFTDIARGPSGEIVCATLGNGLFFHDGHRWTRRLDHRDGLPSDFLVGVRFDGQGQLWAASVDAGAACLTRQGWRKFGAREGLPTDRLNSITFDRKGNPWFCTQGGGVVGLLPNLRILLTRNEGLLSDDVTTMYQDQEGNYWFGSIAGLSRLGGMRFLGYTTRDGLPDNTVWAIYEDPADGAILCGCNSGGIVTLTGSDWKPMNCPDWMKQSAIRCFLRDSRRRLWVGTTGGLACLEGQRWKRYNRDEGYPATRIQAIVEDRIGRLWVGTGRGVVVGNGVSWDFAPKNPLLDGNAVSALFLDSAGRVWVGNQNGLACYDGHAWRNYTTANGLPSNRVTSVSEGKDGHIWVTTFGNGFCRQDGDRFQVWNQSSGLSNNFTYFLVHMPDAIYIGTNKGLNLFTGNSFRVFTQEDGLVSSEVNIGAFLKDSRGEIWIGTVAGISRFDPSITFQTKTSPPVYITSFQLLDNGVPLSDGQELSYSQNNLRFEFIGLHYNAPEKVVYKYNLEGLADQWISTRQRSVSIPFLPPGRYVFRVMACTPDGVWSTRADAVTFEIRPPYWATWWFRTVLLSGAALLLFLVRRVEIRKMRLRSAIEEEFRLAARIQSRLLPEAPPVIPGYDLAAVSIPARTIGGDYYDFIPLDDNRLALCVADVSGKGFPASLLMANLQAIIRSRTLTDPSIEEIVRQANRLLCRNTRSERFVTMFFACLDIRKNTLDYVNAGHNPPLLIREEKIVRELSEGGMILGVMEETAYESQSTDILPRDVIILFSDGVTEAFDSKGSEFGVQRLAEVVGRDASATAQEILDGILTEVRRHVAGANASDDLTLLVIQRCSPLP